MESRTTAWSMLLVLTIVLFGTLAAKADDVDLMAQRGQLSQGNELMRRNRAPGWGKRSGERKSAQLSDAADLPPLSKLFRLDDYYDEYDNDESQTSKRAPGWGKRAPGWGKRAPGWGKRAPGWGKRAPGWGKRAPGWGKRAPGWGKRAVDLDNSMTNDMSGETIAVPLSRPNDQIEPNLLSSLLALQKSATDFK